MQPIKVGMNQLSRLGSSDQDAFYALRLLEGCFKWLRQELSLVRLVAQLIEPQRPKVHLLRHLIPND